MDSTDLMRPGLSERDEQAPRANSPLPFQGTTEVAGVFLIQESPAIVVSSNQRTKAFSHSTSEMSHEFRAGLEHAVILQNRDSRIGLVMIQGLCWRRLEASMDDATLF